MVRLELPEMNRRNMILFSLLIVILAIPSYLIYDYTQHNPKFCKTCHLMNDAYDTWNYSAMHELDCHKCHETDMIESMGHVVEVLFEDPQEVTKITEVDNELCIKCHASNNYEWIQVMTTEGHRLHFFDASTPPDCISCHGLNLHVFEPPVNICKSCHNETTWMNTDLVEMHCIDCHEFSSRVMFPDSEDCMNCHDFARIQSIIGDTEHQKVTVETYCMSCHNPHSEDKYEDCRSCHTSEYSGLHEISSHQTCSLCHSPHDNKGYRKNCLFCHKNKDDHYSYTKCELCHSFIS